MEGTTGNFLIGFIDKTGKWVIEPQFQMAGVFSEGLAAASNGDKWGYIDNTGNWVVHPQFHTASEFSDGLAYVSDLNGWSYIDKSGKAVFYADY